MNEQFLVSLVVVVELINRSNLNNEQLYHLIIHLHTFRVIYFTYFCICKFQVHGHLQFISEWRIISWIIFKDLFSFFFFFLIMKSIKVSSCNQWSDHIVSSTIKYLSLLIAQSPYHSDHTFSHTKVLNVVDCELLALSNQSSNKQIEIHPNHPTSRTKTNQCGTS